MSRCTECGQMMTSDREELCERCEKLQQIPELEEEIRELQEECSEKAAVYDKIIELLSYRLTAAQVLDMAFVLEGEFTHQEWASQRNVSPPAIYNNISDGADVVDNQMDLSEFEEIPEPTPEEQEAPEPTPEETHRQLGEFGGYQSHNPGDFL